MATEVRSALGRRLPAANGQVIDRSKAVTFRFDGKDYQAHPGDTIASALLAAGVDVLSRSFKYHRPRGALCCAGHCPNCLVQVGPRPNVRACMEPVTDGMQVASQNAWPSRDWDAMAVAQLGSRFMPAGFYYKTFIRPGRMWPVFDRMLRNAAGLGMVDPGAEAPPFDKQYLHPDVTVVGGGPAGRAAAREAAQQGARVLLCDENPSLGGSARYLDPDHPFFDAPLGERVTVLTDTTVVGAYQGLWVAAVRGQRLYKVRTRSLVLASGGYQNPLLFNGNDIPGVMLAGAVSRLINLYGVAPGRRIIVMTANDAGWALAEQLQRLGLGISAVVEERERSRCPAESLRVMETAQVPLYFGHTVISSLGRGRVRGALIAPMGDAPARAQISIQGDLIAISAGHTPAVELALMVGGRAEYDDARGELLLRHAPAGVFVAGRAAGIESLDLAVADGMSAGRRAAAYAGYGTAPDPAEERELAVRRESEPRSQSTLIARPGPGKRFVCYCEDVTTDDIAAAVAEGYESQELLKRYTTASMGPCQGKMCGLNSMHLCDQAAGRRAGGLGRTTARPPTTPIELGVLAGQHLHPVQHGPLHDWHLERGARMTIAGLGLRPEHYGDPLAEARAVREAVGLIDVSSLGKIRLVGSGTPEFLDRVYVNRWRKLAIGQVRYGLMCDDEGIVLDDGVTARVGQAEWYMSTTSAGASRMFEWLQWWRQSGWGQDVWLTSVTESFAAFNLAGPRSREVLAPLTDVDVSNAAFPYMQARCGNVAGVPSRVFRIGFTGELSYEIHVPAGFARRVWEALLDAGAATGIRPFGLEAQRVLRLEKAHIIVGQDTDALANAVSAGFGTMVKPEKEDFLGRQSLVRCSEKGTRQRLVGFRIAGEGIVPEEGLQIVQTDAKGSHDVIGWVTSSRFSPTLGERIGLCWLPSDRAARVGAEFTIWREGQLLTARVHHGAFYDPEGSRVTS